MRVTEKIAEEVIAVLQKQGAFRPCSFCGKNNWGYADAFYFMVAQDDMPNINLSGRGMPCMAFLCGNCGNAQFVNLLKLGLGGLIGMKEEPPEQDGA